MFSAKFESQDGYDKGIGELVYMLQHTRMMTEFEVAELTEKQLDYLLDPTSNSIGMLLQHIASIESCIK
ncbi:hypothetical protein JCM19037_394 [Geomicrobium sp. JCM 19037]|nr:hypothetical protein JCM19037_394 [Geomicrobium sp. JCM 19037]